MATIRGGEKLKAKMMEMARLLSKPATLRVGFLEGATYPNTAKKTLRATYSRRAAKGTTGAVAGAAGGLPVAMIAAIQNFGAPSRGIPPRPFFSNMIKDKSPEWSPAIAGLLKDGLSPVEALEQVGQAIAGQLRQSIRDTNAPPLSPSTIRRKGFAKPLIDTGHMSNSVDYEVNT